MMHLAMPSTIDPDEPLCGAHGPVTLLEPDCSACAAIVARADALRATGGEPAAWRAEGMALLLAASANSLSVGWRDELRH